MYHVVAILLVWKTSRLGTSYPWPVVLFFLGLAAAAAAVDAVAVAVVVAVEAVVAAAVVVVAVVAAVVDAAVVAGEGVVDHQQSFVC